MQKQKITALCFVFTIIILVSSCGKYDDGPAFSIIPKKSRVANTWKIEKVFINDVDRTNLFADFISAYKLELTSDEKLTETMTTSLGTFTENGTWEFVNSAESIAFTVSGSKTTFKIMRLKTDEMWLEKTEGTQKYTYHYATY